MLVLSRKPNETIVFPNLGISIEVLRVAGKSVSVGIRAPEKLRILRGELLGSEPDKLSPSVGAGAAKSPSAKSPAAGDEHALRNRLNKASLAMHLVQKQIQAGKLLDAEHSLSEALDSFADLERQAAVERPSMARPAIGGRTDKQALPTNGKPRALLVEDDANERELLAAYLRLSGYEVETAEDGAAAVEYLQEQQSKPAVILMDMQMPRMNGRQTVEAIRSNPEWNAIRLIVVSGTKENDMGVPSGDRGVTRWFEKPLKPDDLVNHLAQLN